MSTSEKRTGSSQQNGSPEPTKTQRQIKPEEGFAAAGCTIEEIAAAADCRESTLRRRKRRLRRSRLRGQAQLRLAQWKKAVEGDVRMLIWLGKQMLHQADKPAAGEEEGTRRVKVTLNIKNEPRD